MSGVADSVEHLDRGRNQGGGVGQHAGAGKEIAHDFAGEWEATRRLVQCFGASNEARHAGKIVVLQILAHPRELMMHRDADAAQMVWIADAGELQDMRRADRTRGEDHLGGRVDPLDRAAASIFDADSAFAIEQDTTDQSIGHDLQVRTFHRRAQIGPRRALAAPAASGLLHPADIVAGAGRQMIDVLVIFEPDLGSGLNQFVAQEGFVGGPRSQ